MSIRINETHYSVLSLVKIGDEYRSAQLEFVAETSAGELPPAVVERAEQLIPLSYLGMVRNEISLKRVEDDVFNLIVDYTQREDQTPSSKKPGEATVSFRASEGNVVNYKIALATTRYGAGGLNDAPDTKNVVGLLNGEVFGVDVPEGDCEVVVEYRMREQGADTTGDNDIPSMPIYLKSLIEAQDKHAVNDASWEIGGILFTLRTLRFMSFEANPVRAKNYLTGLGAIYDFSCVFKLSVSKSDLLIKSAAGDITVSSKPGQHYLEVKFTEKDIDGDLIEEPKYAYVHQLYEEVDYTDLFKVF